MALLPTDLGRDIGCTTGLRTGRFVTKGRLVGEAAYRRLTTPRGMLRDDLDYGLDLTEMIGSANPRATAAALPGQIKSELLKDQRIVSVDADVTVSTSGPATTFTIDIRAETTLGPFTLALLASDVTVELLGIAEAST
jgi:hypothetical protein